MRIGRYELGPELGRGGMARVHLGRLVGAVGFARPVAIKSLHPGLANDASFVKMFIDEARLAAHVHHPNVVAVHDVVAEDGALYLVMEYVPGATLDVLVARGAPPIPIALALIAGTLAGLHAAHEARGDDGDLLHIVHRDVSPQNVIVSRDGVAKLLDFGVAKARSRMHATSAGEVKGKLPYMSPEQLAAKPIDRRSDVFSTGVMLWELLTGARLFQRDEEPATAVAVMQGEVEPPSTRRAEVPAALDAVVMRCLARDPDARFPDAHAALVAIEALGLAATGRETAAWMLATTPAPAAAIAALTTETQPAAAAVVAPAAPVILRPRRARGLWHVAVAAGVIAAAAGLGIALHARDDGAVAASPVSAPSPAPVAPVVAAPTPAAPAAAPTEAAASPTPPAPAAKHHAKPSHAKPPAGKADCRVVNADGTIGYRPECLK